VGRKQVYTRNTNLVGYKNERKEKTIAKGKTEIGIKKYGDKGNNRKPNSNVIHIRFLAKKKKKRYLPHAYANYAR
jgi:hypothetical protein